MITLSQANLLFDFFIAQIQDKTGKIACFLLLILVN